jgi:methyl coenzyme M reductase subunit D
MTKVWQILGGDGDPALGDIVTSGPFGFDVSDASFLNDPTIFDNLQFGITVDPMDRQNGLLTRAE